MKNEDILVIVEGNLVVIKVGYDRKKPTKNTKTIMFRSTKNDIYVT